MAFKMMSKISPWKNVKIGPADPILSVNEAFRADVHANKVDLGIGAYRTDEGKSFLLPSVVIAEQRILERRMDKEYFPITGSVQFNKLATKLIYGEKCAALNENRLVVAQSCSGTGALRYGGSLFSKFYENKNIFLPNPSWGNHKNMFVQAGLSVNSYRYYDLKNKSLDIVGMLEDLSNAKDGSIILLHACAHNPTGLDPTIDQWHQISSVCKEKNHFIFFDSAYQGFASGDCDKDAYAIRYFEEQGHRMCLSQSFAKNMGLYGERVGTFSLVTDSIDEKKRIESQLKIIIRGLISNPPIHGALIVSEILGDEELKMQWLADLKGMAERINNMRYTLRNYLEDSYKSSLNWSHITNQIGMFCFSGLHSNQVDRLRDEFHIYMTQDGRMSMAGVNSSNVKYVAESIFKVAG